MHVGTKKLKETVPWGSVKWTEMRKRNIQAKKLYSSMDRLCGK